MAASRPRLSLLSPSQGSSSPSSSSFLGVSSAQQSQQNSQDGAGAKVTSVQVAVRVRPLNSHDQDTIAPRWQRTVVNPTSSNSVQVDPSTVQPDAPASVSGGIKKQAWTFDRVLGPESGQEDVYAVAQPLISHFLEGYNATILAYGQTSSGKSFTMGTTTADIDFESLVAGQSPDAQIGIIPRAVAEIFASVKASQRKTGGVTFFAKASFIEIYNEELIDLLADGDVDARPHVQIREDKAGNILWSGLREVKVQGVTDVMNLLLQGSAIRRTNETDMNAQSSRSHAIFSLTLSQQRWVGTGPPPPPSAALSSSILTGGRTTPSGRTTPTGRTSSGIPRPVSMLPQASRSASPSVHSSGRTSMTGSRPVSIAVGSRSTTPLPGGLGSPNTSVDGSWQQVTSKFHFVDLAGSERLKRTNAGGDRAKEGISINAGLHALGNVISSLGDPSKAKRTTHVPYRDSKLTRLLQDSLGGNAHTLMIACVAPTEYNVGETINTLQYANRARNIKNKVEQGSVEIGWDDISYLQTTVTRLRKELSILQGAKGSTDVASLKALDDKEIMLWQGKYADESRRCAELTYELTKLQQSKKGKGSAEEDDKAFLEAAEPIIVTYEKAIDDLEGRLNLMKAALSHSEDLINELDTRVSEQDQRIVNAEHQLETRETTIVELQARLAKVQSREAATEEYARDLETRLQSFTRKDTGKLEASGEMKKEMARMKETELSREAYVKDLEERLAKADANVTILAAQVERLEKDVERRGEAYKELQQRLEALSNDDQTKALMEDFQRSEQSNLELQTEIDSLKDDRDTVIKERGRLNDAVAAHELHRGSLEDKIRELEGVLAANASRASDESNQSLRNGTLTLTNGSDPNSSDHDLSDRNGSAVPSSPLKNELDSLRQQLLASREGEAEAKRQVEALNAKHQETLEELRILNLRLSASEVTSTPPRGRRPSSEAGFSEPREELEDPSGDDPSKPLNARVSLSRRSSLQYVPHRPSDIDDSPGSRTDERPSLSRRASGSFFGYRPRQGGLDDSPSRREKRRSLSQSLSQELSSATSGIASMSENTPRKGPRPLSLSGSSTTSFSVPASPTMMQTPGGKQLEGRSQVNYDRKMATLEKGILSLQEALRKRDAEIFELEAALRARNETKSDSEPMGAIGLNIISPTSSNIEEMADIPDRPATVPSEGSSLGIVGASPTPSDYPQAFFTPAMDHDGSTGHGNYFTESMPRAENGSLPSQARPHDQGQVEELMRKIASQEEAHRGKTEELSTQLEIEREKVEMLEKTAQELTTTLGAEIEQLKEQLAAAEKPGSGEGTPRADGTSNPVETDKIAVGIELAQRNLAEEREKFQQREQAFEEKVRAFEEEVAQANLPTLSAVPKDELDAGNNGEIDREALTRMTEEHQLALEMVTAEHTSYVDKLLADHREALSSTKAAHDSQFRQMEQALESTIATLMAEKDDAVASVRKEYAEHVAKVEGEHAQVLSIQLAEKDASHQAVLAEQAGEIDRLAKQHQESLELLNQKHMVETSSLRAEAEAALTAAITAAEANHTRSASDTATALEAEHQAAIASLEEKAETERQRILADVHTLHQSERQRMAEQHEASIAALREQHQKDVESLTRRLSILRDVDGNDVDVDQLRVELAETSDALVILEDALTSVSAERDQLAEELNKLRSADSGGQMETLQMETSTLRREVETYRLNLTNLKAELQRSKSEVSALTEEKSRHEQQIRELEDRRGGKSPPGRLRDGSEGFVSPSLEDTPSFTSSSTVIGQSGSIRGKSMPPPTPPPKMPPPPAPPLTSGSGNGGTLPRSSVPLGARTSLSSLMTRADSPGPSTPTGMSGGSGLTRSSSGTSKHTSVASVNINGLGNQEAKKLLAEQGEELKQLAKQLAHCEADLRANIDLVTTLEAALNDSERNLRKSRVQLGEATRERDRFSSQVEDLQFQVEVAQREVENVKTSTLVEKQEFEQRIRAERLAKEKAARDLEARLEEVNRKKSSKLFCL